jgi:hypothetical protein
VERESFTSYDRDWDEGPTENDWWQVRVLLMKISDAYGELAESAEVALGWRWR